LNRADGTVVGAAVARALPTLAVCLCCVWLAIVDGGFYVRTWSAAVVALAALVVVVTLAGWHVRVRPTRPAQVALAALVGFTTWSFASALWAASPGDAVDGAMIAALYLAAFSIPVLWPCSPGGCVTLLRAIALGLAALGAVAVVRVASGSGDLVYARLAWPTGYPNATAAMDALGAWLALTLATRPGSRVLRGLSFGAAVWLGGLVVLTQSRGAVFTAPLAAVVLVLLARRRLATALQLGLAVLLLVPALPSLLAVLTAEPAAQVDAVVRASLVLGLVAAVAAAVHAVASSHLDRLAPSISRRSALLVTLGVLVVAVAAVAASSPSSRAAAAWHQLTGTTGTTGATRFTGLGSNRADFWRVGLHAFERHPVGGIGVGNFQAAYLRERRSDEAPRAPHSIVVSALAGTGLVGTALLAVAFVAIAVALLPVARRSRADATAAHASAVALTGWLAHAGLDWLWEMPASGFAALAVAGMGVGASAVPRRPPRHAVLRACVAVAAFVVGIGAATTWLADRLESRAIATWRSAPAAADRDLSLAARLDPLGTDALVLQGAIASRRGRWNDMRRAYAAAGRRDGSDWYVQRELAVAHAHLGDRAAARAAARRAAALNPREADLRNP
jgi:hypothetical protein